MTSHTSHVGHTGNTSHVGYSGSSGTPGTTLFADRIDLPFVTISGIAAARAGHSGRFAPNVDVTYKSWGLLAAFADLPQWQARQRRTVDGTILDAVTAKKADGTDLQDAAGQPIKGLSVTPWFRQLGVGKERSKVEALVPNAVNPDKPGEQVDEPAALKAKVDDELENLILAAEVERADALGEILSQNTNFIPDFMGLINATPTSHPATFTLIFSATLVAGFAVQHFKIVNDRRRPSQVCPALKPPLPVPGHASYPSGHATQAHLIADLLTDVFSGKPQADLMPAVRALATRVARNREIAGLHYPSDSTAGKILASDLWPLLRTMPELTGANPTISAGAGMGGLLADAQGEWR